MNSDLFAADSAYEPLAARLRPQTLDDYIGQEQGIGPGTPLRRSLEAGHLHSLIFWGPPGVGKTTLARLLANYVDAAFNTLRTELAGIKEIRVAVVKTQQYRAQGRMSVLFIDEVLRFNISQQYAFLPYVEDSTFIFVSAT